MARKLMVKLARRAKMQNFFANFFKMEEIVRNLMARKAKIAKKWPVKNVKVDRQKCESGPI